MKSLKDRANRLKLKVSAVALAMHRDDTPLYAKIACGLCVGYALSTIDLIPDFVPILGYLDDVIVLPCLVWLCLKLIPQPIMELCLEQSASMWENGRPKSWKYAIPIIIIWAMAALWVIHMAIHWFTSV